MQEVILFYNGFDVPTRQILDSRGAIPTKIAVDAKKAIQEMVEYSQKWHNGTSRGRSTKTSDRPAAIQAQLNNLGREIKKVNKKVYAAQVGCASVSVMPLLTYLNLGLGKLAHTKLIVELADRTVKYPKGIAENVLVRIGKFTFPIDFIILDMPEDIKVPLILGRPFLSIARAKIDVYKRKITLRVREEKIIFKSVKPASSLIKRVYMLSLRERMELDLEARLMGETLVINRSLDPLNGDYIELNDLNEPFELRRNQGDDLMPTIEEGEVIEEFRTRDEDLDTGIDDYPSYCDDDKKIHIDFLEDMDAYHDNEMGEIIFGEPFLREVRIKTKRFEGIITLYNGDNEVTYQMVRSHPKFKHHTNEQCNKIPPLLKVSLKDKINGISHACQKLKGFYKEVLNRGPDFIRVLTMEEWLTRGHISMHELE
ncbi:gag-pol polyprotein [Tanacetum coccineum]